MVKQWWSSSEMSPYDHDFRKTMFNDDYYGCDYAKQYYLKAMQETKDKNLKKLSAYMAGVCQDNHDKYSWYIKHPDKDIYNYKRKNNFYKELTQKRNQ